MNTTTSTQTTTETKNTSPVKKALFSSMTLEKKAPMRTLSLRPSRSFKKNNSLKPLLLKKI